MKARHFIAIIGIALGVVAFFLTHVDQSLSADEEILFEKLVKKCNIRKNMDEIELVSRVQECVIEIVPHRAYAHNIPHEPIETFKIGYGECYDRSRIIEKFLNFIGFKTRHAAVYDTSVYGVSALLRPGVPSHALLDVKLERGWMAVGSNQKSIGLTRENRVVAVRDLKKYNTDHYINPLNPILVNDNITIYGLWSRHGGFFPPYSGLPDVHWPSLIHPGFPRWIGNLMTFVVDSAIRINAIRSSRRASPVSPGG